MTKKAADRLSPVSVRRRLAQVIPIDQAARQRLRDAFLHMAKLAEQGAITGAVYSVIDRDGRIRPGTLGQAQSNGALAHYAASQLADRLLYPDESDCD